MSNGIEIPDYCEPLVGYRLWDIRAERVAFKEREAEAEYRVVSTQLLSRGRVLWPFLKPLEATHQVDFTEGPTYCPGCPGANHTPYAAPGCGIYAFKTRDIHYQEFILEKEFFYTRWRGIPRSVVCAIGEVYLWGRIYEHKRGYRAQYAYPKKLVYVTGEGIDGHTLAKSYGIPYEEDLSWKLDNPFESLSQNRFASQYLGINQSVYLTPRWSNQPSRYPSPQVSQYPNRLIYLPKPSPWKSIKWQSFLDEVKDTAKDKK